MAGGVSRHGRGSFPCCTPRAAFVLKRFERSVRNTLDTLEQQTTSGGCVHATTTRMNGLTRPVTRTGCPCCGERSMSPWGSRLSQASSYFFFNAVNAVNACNWFPQHQKGVDKSRGIVGRSWAVMGGDLKNQLHGASKTEHAHKMAHLSWEVRPAPNPISSRTERCESKSTLKAATYITYMHDNNKV